jgi:hypothetical protein
MLKLESALPVMQAARFQSQGGPLVFEVALPDGSMRISFVEDAA